MRYDSDHYSTKKVSTHAQAFAFKNRKRYYY